MNTHAEPMSQAGHDGSLNRTAALATLHCLTGCAIGEVLGMVIGTALGFSNAATIALAVTLAFVFGYSLTMVPLVRAGLAFGVALPLAFAADSFSIAVMELVDNGVMLAVPGAMDAPLSNPLFWGALAFALAVAYVVAYPVNRHLIARGQGHAVVHAYHGHGPASGEGSDEAGAPATVSARRLIVIGLTAMAVTITVATGGALLVESHGSSPDEHGPVPAMPAAHGDGSGGPAGLGGLAIAEGRYRLQTQQTVMAAGAPSTFEFAILDEEGTVREFDEHGGVRMHLVVVRRDLTGYQHLHPVQTPDGAWRARLRLPSGGAYRAFADFERDGVKTVLGFDLLAAGAFDPQPLPAPGTVTDVDGYRVELTTHAEAGAESTLEYRITRAGRPVDTEPYLGAAGHLVALRAGDLAYLHVHPIAASRGEVAFAATFPTAGSYRLVLQFKAVGRVHTAPLTLAVTDGH